MKDSKLRVEAETVFGGVVPASADNQQKVSILRVFAKGGFVVTEYIDLADGERKFRMLSATEAAKRAAALLELGRTSNGKAVSHELVTAITKACLAARAQSDAGGNPILNTNNVPTYDLDQMAEELKEEIRMARSIDAGLDSEMTLREARG